MFTKPKYGWTEIHLEDFEGLGSYIQDIPVFVLKNGVQSVQEWTPLELWFDEEGSAFTLTADEESQTVTLPYGANGTITFQAAFESISDGVSYIDEDEDGNDTYFWDGLTVTFTAFTPKGATT